MSEIIGSNESRSVGAPMTLPVFLPSDSLVQSFTEKDNLPEGTKALVSAGYMTVEEAVSFHQWHLMMCELGMNVAEFLHVYRAIKAELSRKASGLVLPEGY